MKKVLKLPSVSFDIDGVLKKGRKAIPRAKEAIIKLRERKIPLSLITNNGGELESVRGEKISKILDLEERHKLSGREVFMCHSPMQELVHKFKDKFVLISGVNNITEVMENYGFVNYMTTMEYATIYQKLAPIISYQISRDQRKVIIENVEKRLNKSLEGDKNLPQVNALFVLSGLLNWEINTQIFSDLIISVDGFPGSIRKKDEKQFVELHVAAEDLLYKDVFSLPRITNGGFMMGLKMIFKQMYGFEIDYEVYGKPETKLFNFARNFISKNIENNETEISNFYMIGDNPEIDIHGANLSNFVSILVKTGVFSGDLTPENYRPKHIVNDALDAVDLILKLENL